MPVGLMPFLIHFMGDQDNNIAMNRGCPFAAEYRLIRDCDCAELFGFPSVERLRIESLEREIEELRESLSAVVRNLERENEERRESAKVKDGIIRALGAKVEAMEEAAPPSARKKRRSS